jgi:predicted DNA-binding antitoxin AbrB/MazE fold protein
MFQRALEQEKTLNDVYNDATVLLCSELRNVAIQRALGSDGKTDKDGNEVGPDANLALRLLEKLDPQFSRGEEVKVVVSVEDIIHELNKKRQMENEKKEEIIKRNEEKGIDVI